MNADVRVATALLVPLMAVGGGCASVGTAATSQKVSGPGTTTAPAPAQAHIVQAAWPGEAVRMVKGHAVDLDAFEALLLGAGVDALEQLPSRERPLDREGATRLLALLLDKPLPLRSYPQRMGACFLLREVLENGSASRDELNRRVDRFRQVAVLRPDGYLAWVRNGRTQQRAGPGQVEFKDGVFKANGFVLGQFYSGQRGAYHPVDAQLQPLWGSDILGEVYDDGDLFGRAMDGAGEAFFALAMALGKFFSRPLDGIAELRNLPAGVAALIASSPEYLERFKLMTAGEQIQAASKLTTTLLTIFAGSGAVSTSLAPGLGGMEVASLSLSAQGTLALGRVVVPAGGAVTVLAAAAGAPIVLQSTAAAGRPAEVDGLKGGSADSAKVAGAGARIIVGPGGRTLDVTRIRIPGPRNSPFGKVDYLLGNVGSVESVGKGGFFRGVLGFSEGNLGPALERHLIENFGTATIEGSRIRVTGTLIGPGGRAAMVQSVWQVTPEGFVELITAVPR